MKINEHSPFKPVYCPVLREEVDPCRCYDTRMGMDNILESAGVRDNETIKVCSANCEKFRGFVEKEA